MTLFDSRSSHGRCFRMGDGQTGAGVQALGVPGPHPSQRQRASHRGG